MTSFMEFMYDFNIQAMYKGWQCTENNKMLSIKKETAGNVVVENNVQLCYNIQAIMRTNCCWIHKHFIKWCVEILIAGMVYAW